MSYSKLIFYFLFLFIDCRRLLTLRRNSTTTRDSCCMTVRPTWCTATPTSRSSFALFVVFYWVDLSLIQLNIFYYFQRIIIDYIISDGKWRLSYGLSCRVSSRMLQVGFVIFLDLIVIKERCVCIRLWTKFCNYRRINNVQNVRVTLESSTHWKRRRATARSMNGATVSSRLLLHKMTPR